MEIPTSVSIISDSQDKAPTSSFILSAAMQSARATEDELRFNINSGQVFAGYFDISHQYKRAYVLIGADILACFGL